MSYTGTIKGGVVVLPSGVQLPEGAQVEVILQENGTDPLLAAIEEAAKPRPHWPADYALNHGHYVTGEPRKL